MLAMDHRVGMNVFEKLVVPFARRERIGGARMRMEMGAVKEQGGADEEAER